MTRTVRLLSLLLVLMSALARRAAGQDGPRFVFPRDTSLIDEKLNIVLAGLRPGSFVTIRAHVRDTSSYATFVADRAGRVTLATAVPLAGTYLGADPMGLFWSLPQLGPIVRSDRMGGPPQRAMPFPLTAEADGAEIVTDTVWRRAVSADVRITRIREGGFQGTLYEPPGAGRRAAVVVLSGSQGGTTPAIQWPGGLSSRGYVVLALPYFNEEGLPAQLASIPLEYFEGAINWLRARPNVDSSRIAVLGGSRGGELALLLAATFPRLVNAVIATAPSSVAWPGCCDMQSGMQSAWTLGGRPVPHMPPTPELSRRQMSPSAGATRMTPRFLYRLSDSAAVARAAIPVERISGPVLLVSGKDDGLWPSYDMAEQVMARLRAHQFTHPYKHLSYEGLGHGIMRPYNSAMNLNDNVNPISGQRNDMGGVPSFTARAREDAWAQMLAFLDTYLRPRDSRAER